MISRLEQYFQISFHAASGNEVHQEFATKETMAKVRVLLRLTIPFDNHIDNVSK